MRNRDINWLGRYAALRAAELRELSTRNDAAAFVQAQLDAREALRVYLEAELKEDVQ
jgi:hypothetical protein